MKRLAACIAAALTTVYVSNVSVAGQETDGKANQLPLRFIDVNGKVLGRAVWSSEEGLPTVVMQEAKHVFAMSVYNGGEDSTQFNFFSAPLYFEAADCSGQGYVPAAYMLVGLRTAVVVVPPDERTLIYVGSGRRKSVHIMAIRNPDSTCHSYDFNQFLGDPVDAVVDITGKFQGPFTIR
jgi:hypothetical protein